MAIKTISFRAWFAGNDDDDDGDEVTGEGVEEVACGACIAIKKFADDEEKEAVEDDDIYIGDIEWFFVNNFTSILMSAQMNL